MLFLRWYLWVAPNVLLLPCLYGLLRRRNYQTFPFFVAYIAAQLALFAAALPVALAVVGSPSYMLVYRRVLIADVGVSGLLGLGVMYELADRLIASRTSLRPVMQHLMQWTVAFLVLIAAFSTALISQSGIEQIMKIFQVLDFSSNLVRLGLLLVVVVFSRVLRVSWRSLPAGIALGFAVLAATEMAVAPLFSELGRNYYQRLDLVRMVAFHACVLTWLVYIFLPANSLYFIGHRPDQADLKAWNQELLKIVR